MSVKLSGLFADNMVLQRDMPVPVWGWGEAGASVTVTFAGQSKAALVAADGKWSVTLDAMPACATPQTLTVAEKNLKSEISNCRCTDVLVGEVWLCSGQSNMEYSVRAAAAVAETLAGSVDGQLRWFRIPPRDASSPSDDVEGQWKVSSRETAAEFSAVAWHFAKRLREVLGVPVGLIHAARGGSVAEAWIRQETLRAEPALRELIAEFDSDVADPEGARKTFDVAQKEWERVTAPHDPGNVGVTQGWAACELNDGDWPHMTMPCYWQRAGELYSGVFWFRKEVEIPATWAGRALRLQLGACDKDDVSYFNGVEIGSVRITERADAWAVLRDYRIAPELVKAGRAVIAVRILSHMHVGGMAGPASAMRLSLADETDGAEIPLAGEWGYRVEHNFGYNFLPALPREPAWPLKPHTPGALYNVMIAPLVPYALRGAIFYQGESNADHPHPEWYRTLFPLLIRDWRRCWNRDFAFHFVQLANFKGVPDTPGESRWAEVRESQRLVLSEPNTGMAVAIDIGDGSDIHPANKHDVGHRLAASVLAKTYGITGIVPSGPLVRAAKAEGVGVRISFDYAAGLVSRGPLRFSVAGTDRVFVWADARIEGETVLVSHPAVRHPVVIRYGWADNPVCNLFNEAGLPASPFEVGIR